MSYYSHTSYPQYNTSYSYSYQGYPNPSPRTTTTTSSSYPSSYHSQNAYATSAPMILNTSQDSHSSSSSANSRYSSNTYASSYGTSPGAPSSPESPTAAMSYGYHQSGYPASSNNNYNSTNQPSYIPLASHQTPTPPLPPSAQATKSSRDKNSNTPQSKPYICLHSNCPRQFTRSFDLGRHLKTHFPDDTPRLDCPKATAGGAAWCNRVGERGFTRQDHLNEHLRKVHLVDLPKTARGTRGSGA